MEHAAFGFMSRAPHSIANPLKDNLLAQWFLRLIFFFFFFSAD
jgi:hypothetical protein